MFLLPAIRTFRCLHAHARALQSGDAKHSPSSPAAAAEFCKRLKGVENVCPVVRAGLRRSPVRWSRALDHGTETKAQAPALPALAAGACYDPPAKAKANANSGARQGPRHKGRGRLDARSRETQAAIVTAVSSLRASTWPTAGAPAEYRRLVTWFVYPRKSVTTRSVGTPTDSGPGPLPWQGQTRRSARRTRCRRWSTRRISWSYLLSGRTAPLAQCLPPTDRIAPENAFLGVGQWTAFIFPATVLISK
jgi:hypothetical protein